MSDDALQLGLRTISETVDPRFCTQHPRYDHLRVSLTRAEARAIHEEIERLRTENSRLAMMSKDCANRTAVTSLGFLAKIARDIGYANRKQESNAEMIGRALRDLAGDK